MADKFRWGIIATGTIAHKFAQGLRSVDNAELAAVGSRDREKAAAFAAKYDAPRFYGSYEELANDPEIDAVYISTPHNFHKANSLLCLNAKKAVLCEKPMAVNAAETRSIITAARQNEVFCMDAMWTRFLPAVRQVRKWLQDGAIGEPRMLTADFGYRGAWNPQRRHLNPELAGGALLDVGVYPIAFAFMVFGNHLTGVTGLADIGETGVDEQSAFVLSFDRGQLASLSCAVRTATPHQARIDGTEGSILLPREFFRATTATLTRPGRQPETIDMPLAGNGYNYEAEEVGRCVRAGQLESNIMPLEETLSIMQAMDTLRQQWNFKYPAE